MLIPILIVLLIFATAITYWGQLNDGEVIIAPIVGIAFAALYSSVDYEDEGVTEYTLQCCILFVSISVKWDRPMTGLDE
jgi:hypothetical protein